MLTLDCSLYCSAFYDDWSWRLETCVEGKTAEVERLWSLCTGQSNNITGEGLSSDLSLLTI